MIPVGSATEIGRVFTLARPISHSRSEFFEPGITQFSPSIPSVSLSGSHPDNTLSFRMKHWAGAFSGKRARSE
jgi:hypothetical protein